jgi:hypothetical protein
MGPASLGLPIPQHVIDMPAILAQLHDDAKGREIPIRLLGIEPGNLKDLISGESAAASLVDTNLELL